ncbi:MAG: hypothetical protein LAO79_03465 [Acidobacteriia bacterium]|nr:hypothetical protein [Terriglobia bacterium]
MPQNYFYPYTQASRAEDKIPSMTYAILVENLIPLTDMGVIAPGNPITMLVAARLVDRTRIAQSGISAATIKRALGEYRAHPKAVFGIVKALEQALGVLARGPARAEAEA